MKDKTFSHGLKADETRILSVFHPRFIRGSLQLSYVSGVSRFHPRPQGFPSNPMHFLCGSYALSMHFLYRLLLKHTPLSARKRRYCRAKKNLLAMRANPERMTEQSSSSHPFPSIPKRPQAVSK
jgi:hypothetical protein